MEPTVLLILLIVSAVIALALIAILRRKPASKLDEAESDYAEGLNLLLVGKREAALKKFRETVTKNSMNIDAYLKIGDILRELGQLDRAINVHKYLTVRSGLTHKQHTEILRSLAKDYMEAKDFDKALSVLNKVIEENKDALWAHKMKLKLFENKEEWEKAFRTYKELRKIDSQFRNGRLALYKVQEGLQLIKNGKDKEAQSRFKDAIKIDPSSPPAYIYLADSYMEEDRKSEALGVLKEFMEKVPSYSYLAFERIKELLYEGGVYGQIENLYHDIIQSQPDNIMAKMALAENYEKKGELQKAVQVCLDVLEKEPTNKAAKKNLVRLYHKSGQDSDALNLALELIDESMSQKNNFTCTKCEYQSDEPFWRCPRCHEWETAIKN